MEKPPLSPEAVAMRQVLSAGSWSPAELRLSTGFGESKYARALAELGNEVVWTSNHRLITREALEASGASAAKGPLA